MAAHKRPKRRPASPSFPWPTDPWSTSKLAGATWLPIIQNSEIAFFSPCFSAIEMGGTAWEMVGKTREMSRNSPDHTFPLFEPRTFGWLVQVCFIFGTFSFLKMLTTSEPNPLKQWRGFMAFHGLPCNKYMPYRFGRGGKCFLVRQN